VPEGEFSRDTGCGVGFTAAEAESCAEGEAGEVIGEFEVGVGIGIALEEGAMERAADEAMDGGDFGGVEEVIDTGIEFGGVACEGLGGDEVAVVKLVVAVGEAAAAEPEGEVGATSEGFSDAEFGVEVDWDNGEAEGEVGVDEAGLIMVIEGVGGDGAGFVERVGVAGLDDAALDGIDLGVERAGLEEAEETGAKEGKADHNSMESLVPGVAALSPKRWWSS
jgi:hypothetical protein